MRSLRARLILGTSLGAALVLVACGLVLDALIEDALEHAFDAGLADKLRSLAAMTEQDDQGVSLEFAERRLPEFEQRKRPDYYQAWIEGGAEVIRSPSLRNRDLPRLGGSPQSPAFRALRLPDGREGRAAGCRFAPRFEDAPAPTTQDAAPPRQVTLVVARDTLDLERALGQVRWMLLAAGAGGVAATVLILAWLVRRGLSPVHRLADRIRRLDERDLAQRLDDREALRELKPVVDGLNGLLQRLEAAFQREKSFVADVAHELRTPLAGLGATLEVSLSRPRSAQEHRQALDTSLAIARRMSALVENLLVLARVDAGQVPVQRQPVSVTALARDTWQPLAAAATARGLNTQWQVDDSLVLDTDGPMLQQVLMNLFDNAVCYADPSGWVRIEARRDGDAALVRVSNSGSRLSPQDVAQACRRFWRGDASRQDTGEHFGLGLSICQRMATLLQARLELESQVGGVFTATLRFGGADHPH